MIGSLRGVVLERALDGTVLIEVGGVGYQVVVSPRALAELEPSSNAFLYVHHHIREDAQTLYGFLARDERATFQVLIATHGVGPALAMAILATHPPKALVDIVAGADVASLTLVPGVGRKTAERLLVELKSRLSVPVLDADGTTSGGSAVGDVREALAGLGYGFDEIREALREVPSSERRGHDVARRAEAVGCRSCVTSSSTRASATTSRRSSTPGSGPVPSPSSSASASSRSTSRSCSKPPATAARRSTTCCSPGRPGWARPRSPASSPPRWECTCTSRPGRRSNAPATWRPSSPSSTRATSCSSTRSIACPRAVEEILYPAMEDFQLDIVVGKGPAASSIRLTLPRFTLVGATTRTGMITGPLRDRFGLVARLDYYDDDELQQIVVRAAGILDVTIDEAGAWEIARRSRGTPRIANRLLRRVRDFAEVRADGDVTADIARAGLALFGVDDLGLDKIDRAILNALCRQFGGGPVGLSTLAISVGELAETVEDVYEPFLIQQGMLARTPRGRVALPAAYTHVGLAAPERGTGPQPGLFD